jgi:hypothetical protein
MFGKRRIASAAAPPRAIYLKSLERDAKSGYRFFSAIKFMQIA